MNLKTLLRDQIEREHAYLIDQAVGSEEYNASMQRLNTLEDKLVDLEHYEADAIRKDKQAEEEKKDRRIRNSIEITKVATGVALPLIGLVAITAFEKDDTFTSALKGYVNCFIPKKLF